jgi:hypothetical protein
MRCNPPRADSSGFNIHAFSHGPRCFQGGERDGSRNKGGGGSWLLRQGVGGGSLGEKLGEAIEIAAYKGT